MDLLTGIATGLIVALICFLIGKNIALLQAFFDVSWREATDEIIGSWTLTETFDPTNFSKYRMDIHRDGYKIKGTHTWPSGDDDKNAKYTVEGEYKNRALQLRWKQVGGIHSGTMTLFLTDNGKLQGAGLYNEPGTVIINSSTVSGEKNSGA
jgi:hypothetical protein